MAHEKLRNSAVGLTIIVAVVLLTWGAFLLGRLPYIGPNAPYRVTIRAGSAMGLTPGDLVSLNGVVVGSVSSVSLTANMQQAKIETEIYRSTKLPVNTVALIGTKTIGTPFVSLYVPKQQVVGYLPTNGTAHLNAKVASSSLIPHSVVEGFATLKADFTRLSGKLDRVADDLHSLLKPVALTSAQAHGEGAEAGDMNNISALVQRLNVTVYSINRLVSSRRLDMQVRTIAANVAKASKQLVSVLQQVQQLTNRAGGFITRADRTATDVDSTVLSAHHEIIALSVKLTRVLGNVNVILSSIAHGHGTAGRLIKDPRLYNSLLTVTHRLKHTVDSLDALLKQIKAEGFDVHVGF
jgi:ABC-type transporter Mla subunit MlaD